MKRNLAGRLRTLRALVLDVDGVLTDGGLYYAESGEEMKRFDVRDGQGLVLLREAGILVALVTRKTSRLVIRRAQDLGITEVHQNATDKRAVVESLLARHKIPLAAACFIGDDLGDLPAMASVALAAAPADAIKEVRAAAAIITKATAGHGAVRELCDQILSARKGKRPPPERRTMRRPGDEREG
ncbi:MAG TPA: HAD hydrolase family protein [Methylomirabilota bacterium]|nr:HAD hydrolase family protein [Methylomirabilota bacterium]